MPRFRPVQPPLGGCVLKLFRRRRFQQGFSAAFRRLCVETDMKAEKVKEDFTAA